MERAASHNIKLGIRSTSNPHSWRMRNEQEGWLFVGSSFSRRPGPDRLHGLARRGGQGIQGCVSGQVRQAREHRANDVALAEAFREASCTVCHAGGENKKIRNDYGKQLAKLVSKEDKKNRAKIQAAMDTVAKLKSNPSDPASPTFGEKIASGKLPATK